jgi:hypothetical protein
MGKKRDLIFQLKDKDAKPYMAEHLLSTNCPIQTRPIITRPLYL